MYRTLGGRHGPMTATPRLVLRDFRGRILMPQRFTGPWKPFPLVIATTSTYCPSLKTSVMETVFPSSFFACSNCSLMVPPSILISVMSGFFFGTPASLGCVAARRRNSEILSRFSSIFFRVCSGSKCSGNVTTRSKCLGGSFIQASVNVCKPYGSRVYARMANSVIGGVSTTVAGWAVSLPKFGDRSLSSTRNTWVIPAL